VRIGLRRKSEPSSCQKLKEDRGEGAIGNVVILAGEVSAMPIWKGVRHGCDRIVEFFGALLPADYQGPEIIDFALGRIWRCVTTLPSAFTIISEHGEVLRNQGSQLRSRL
jgi:hypothetical protein